MVLDASVVVELITNSQLGDLARLDLSNWDGPLMAPYLLDLEVLSALRGLNAARKIDSHRAHEALVDLEALPVERHSHLPLVGRIWELRHNFTCYDASYIALAEATNSVLYTSDRKLLTGHRARVAMPGSGLTFLN